MATKRIVVSGGGDNLYRVVEDGNNFNVSHVIVSVFTNSYNRIGQSKTFEDAMQIIKSHSGKQIEKITNW